MGACTCSIIIISLYSIADGGGDRVDAEPVFFQLGAARWLITRAACPSIGIGIFISSDTPARSNPPMINPFGFAFRVYRLTISRWNRVFRSTSRFWNKSLQFLQKSISGWSVAFLKSVRR